MKNIFYVLIFVLGISFSGFKIFEKSENFIVFMYVGQGDSTLVNISENQILIDCGKNSIANHKISKYMKKDKNLEYLIITHPDTDHFAGCIEILKSFNVKNIILNGQVDDTDEWKFFEKTMKSEIRSEKTRILFVQNMKNLKFPGNEKNKKYVFNFLFPKKSGNFKNKNAMSIIVDFWINDFPVAIFTGDSELEQLHSEKIPKQKYEILKIPHHGSKKNTDENLIKKFDPKIAVISAGKNNPYNHPHPDIISILKNHSKNSKNQIKIKELKNFEESDFLINIS